MISVIISNRANVTNVISLVLKTFNNIKRFLEEILRE